MIKCLYPSLIIYWIENIKKSYVGFQLTLNDLVSCNVKCFRISRLKSV